MQASMKAILMSKKRKLPEVIRSKAKEELLPWPDDATGPVSILSRAGRSRLRFMQEQGACIRSALKRAGDEE